MHRDERLIPVARVKATGIVVMAQCEAGDDLIAPVPDAVVGGPSGVPVLNPVNGGVLNRNILYVPGILSALGIITARR